MSITPNEAESLHLRIDALNVSVQAVGLLVQFVIAREYITRPQDLRSVHESLTRRLQCSGPPPMDAEQDRMRKRGLAQVLAEFDRHFIEIERHRAELHEVGKAAGLF